MPSASIAGAVLTIDLGAIGENYRRLKRRLGNVACAAVVKADAYGLGMSEVAPTLAGAGCGTFFVAHLSEGIRLRELLSPSGNLRSAWGPPRQRAGLSRPRPNPGIERSVADRRLGAPGARGRRAAGSRARGHRHEPLGSLSRRSRCTGRLTGVAGGHRGSLLDEPSRRRRGSRPSLEIESSSVGSKRSVADCHRLRPASPTPQPSFSAPNFTSTWPRSGVALYGVNPTPGTPQPDGGSPSFTKQNRRSPEKLTGQRALATVPPTGRPGRGGLRPYRSAMRMATSGHSGNCAHVGVAGQSVPVVGRISMDLITLDVTEAAAGDGSPRCSSRLDRWNRANRCPGSRGKHHRL